MKEDKSLELSEKLKQIHSVSKVEKVKLYRDIIEVSFQQRQDTILQYLDEMLKIIDEYLTFDSKLTTDLSDCLGKTLKIAFRYIQCRSDLESFEKYLAKYLQYGDLISEKQDKAEIYQSFGYLFWLKQDTQSSIRYLKESLELINSTGLIQCIPQRYTNLGFIYEHMGNYDQAESYYIQGLNFAKENSFDYALKMAYAALGRLNLRKGCYDLALEYFANNLSFYDSDEESIEKDITKLNLATTYSKMNQHRDALKILLELDKPVIKENDPELYYSILSNLGTCYLEMSEYDKAEPYVLLDLKFAQENSANNHIIGCQINLGIISMHKKNYTQALDYLQNAAKNAELSENTRQKIDIFRFLGDVSFKTKKFSEAVANYNKALQFANSCKNEHQEAIISKKISLSYAKLNKYTEAYHSLKKFTDYDEIVKQKQIDDLEMKNKKIIRSPQKSFYIYSDSISLISQELQEKIGFPLIGKSKALSSVIEKAFYATKNPDVNILICGESGTGKELIAKLIHFSSNRAKQAFIPVNSSLFSSDLAQSALFGHKKGSFTGATNDHTGFFEAADNGTIFFDEIGEMPLEIQAKILRVLETKHINPLGSSKTKKVNFRLITATHRNLQELINTNQFRFDLYHRINTIELYIPPLRERKEDIPLIIDFYLKNTSQKLNKKIPKISQKAMNNLFSYNYPGNVRELMSIIERILIFNDRSIIDTEDLNINNTSGSQNIQTIHTNLNIEENEILLIKQAMIKSNYIKTEAAKLLGISPYALARRLNKFKNLDF